jgi:hypothetical protein
MSNTYAIELWSVASGPTPCEIFSDKVRAQDRYEAVALARRIVESQHPQINLATVDTWFVARCLD